jgi:ribosomal-protein-alanine N-acetyltransferase
MVSLKTRRLVLRPISPADLDEVADMNADPRVMDPLGGPLDREKSAEWLTRLVAHWKDHDYGRFFVTHGDDFVAIVGLSRADFDAGVMPGIEIAWRAPFAQWRHGYVTEAARAVLVDGFDRLGLDEIVAATTLANARSRKVMERLGMTPAETFEHERLPPGHPLRTHQVFRLKRV